MERGDFSTRAHRLESCLLESCSIEIRARYRFSTRR